MPTYSCRTDSCRPIHARPIRALYDRFMPVPIHAKNYSCPTWLIHASTYSCQDWFMPWKSKKISMDYSCPYLFMPRTVHAPDDLFMPVPIHARMNPIHAHTHSCQEDSFMPVPIHAQDCSCREWLIHANTYSCPRSNFKDFQKKENLHLPNLT